MSAVSILCSSLALIMTLSESPRTANEERLAVGVCRRLRQVNRQRQIGPHLFRHVDRDVIEQSAVGVNGILGPHRREDSGQRHGGPQGQAQGPAAENLLLAADQVAGDAGERSRQIVEALDLRVREPRSYRESA